MSFVTRLAPAFAVLGAALLAGCNSVPPTNVHQPMTARPAEPPPVYGNGSIYSAATSRPLFEDRRARFVGDTLTILITEANSAGSKSDDTASRSTSMTAGYPTITNLPGKSFQGTALSASGASSLAGKGETTNSNTFTGSITVTVIEVLSNGNLLVSGEKQVSIGPGQQYIRLSGIINPAFISASNTVPSSSVADARVEYKESGQFAETQVMGWLARFFLNVLPF